MSSLAVFPPDPSGQPQDPIPQPAPVAPGLDYDGFPLPPRPWMDEEFPSQEPVVPQVKVPLPCAPCWGFTTPFNVGDLEPAMIGSVLVMNALTHAATSNALNIGALRYEIFLEFTDLEGVCDVNLIRCDPGGDTVVKSYKQVTSLTNHLYLGGQDLINMGALPMKVQLLNVNAGGGTITVTVAGH